MNTISNFVYKLGMMDRFGYTYIHAAIDSMIIALVVLYVSSFI